MRATTRLHAQDETRDSPAPPERIAELTHKIETLRRAGKLTNLEEPIGVDLFEPLPPLESIHTKRVYQAAAPSSIHSIIDRIRYHKVKQGLRARSLTR